MKCHLLLRPLSLLVLLVGGGSLSIQAQSGTINRAASPSDIKRLRRLETQFEQLRSLLRIPGLSAAIVKDQKLLWTKGFGYADVEKRVPATPNTLYYIASLTKTFATTVLMQLVEQGKLDLDEPMSRYSNEFKDDSLKVRHVLSHTSTASRIPSSLVGTNSIVIRGHWRATLSHIGSMAMRLFTLPIRGEE